MPGIYETKIRELYINIKTYFFNVPGLDPPGKYIIKKGNLKGNLKRYYQIIKPYLYKIHRIYIIGIAIILIVKFNKV